MGAKERTRMSKFARMGNPIWTLDFGGGYFEYWAQWAGLYTSILLQKQTPTPAASCVGPQEHTVWNLKPGKSQDGYLRLTVVSDHTWLDRPLLPSPFSLLPSPPSRHPPRSQVPCWSVLGKDDLGWQLPCASESSRLLKMFGPDVGNPPS
ncbi:hypothetical protein N7539_005817 [Penicillium diatomitis]|uniref:Uncharacterized protein n=1 Tax=Penicillium diatomitis TaxID=2819901 RepID=A0A9W9X557_9EURO|nr:uncharacterized protein N7539_005817 [Penicillium diatomitis]KAJ5484021.1 hypothetical protein N7539_005817 [Penicillium diatomitis]